jgi:hypothetical protein
MGSHIIKEVYYRFSVQIPHQWWHGKQDGQDDMEMQNSFVQKWSLLIRKPEKDKVDALKAILIRRVQDFKPLESNPSDIGFI